MLPCSVADVEQAYLEKVKTAHPDRGGTQQQFLELQTAYERAKAYASFSTSRRNWLSDSIERYARQLALADRIESQGGSVEVVALDWLASEIGEDFAQVMEQIEGLRLTGPQFDDQSIDELLADRDLLAQLHWIDLSGSRVTDAGVARLQEFAYLRRIDLADTQVTSASLPTLTSFESLSWVGLHGARIGRLGRFWLRIDRPNLEVAARKPRPTCGFRGYATLITTVIVLYWVSIATATHVPLDQASLPKLPGISIDKLFHVSAYAGLAFLLSTLIAAVWSTHGSGWRGAARYLPALLIAGLYGVLDEVSQPPVGRTADPWDWVADITGATLGLTLFLILRWALKRVAIRCAERRAV
jgi:VanZ family protein